MAADLTVGWAVNGRPGRYVCPVHKRRDVEYTPISVTAAKAGGLCCHVCDEPLATEETRR